MSEPNEVPVDISKLIVTQGYDFKPFEEMVKEALNSQRFMCNEIAGVRFGVGDNDEPLWVEVTILDNGKLTPCQYFPKQPATVCGP